MADEVTRFEEDTLTAGMNVNTRDFSARMELSEDNYNMTMGINKGMGPRYGVAPIPGQNHTESSSSGPVGLQQTEGSGFGFSYNNRLRVYAVIPITEYFPGTAQTEAQTYYIWVVGSDEGGVHRVDFLISSVQNTTFTYPDPDISAGLNYAIQAANTNQIQFGDIFLQRLTLSTTTAPASIDATIKALFSPYSKNYMATAQISVSGANIDMNWVSYYATTAQTPTVTGLGSFNGRQNGAGKPFEPFGMPSSVNLNNYSLKPRTLTFYNLGLGSNDDDFLAAKKTFIYNNSKIDKTVYVPGQDNNFSINSVNPATLPTPTVASFNNSFPDSFYVLLNDPEMTTNSSYQMAFMAADKPLAALIQGWNRSKFGYPLQLIDLTSSRFKPQTGSTLHDAGTGDLYQEDASFIATCWNRWPSWSSQGSNLPKNTDFARTFVGPLNDLALLVTSGAPGSGVLRANTEYEFTYSVYDKFTNSETNVGVPARIRTNADDFVAISLFRSITQDSNDLYTTAYIGQYGVNGRNQNSSVFRIKDFFTGFNVINQLEFRVYYRPYGSFEWLPALQVDVAKFCFYPQFVDLWACQAPIASLPGGQPGGFNDYSELPQDTYFDVKVFQGRTFWCSPKNVVFSYRNNPFAYAGRNSLAAPTGVFKGMIVHLFFGQSEQTGRLVIFGTKETYAATFTGSPVISPIQIDPNTIGNYPVDGSDFTINSRTTVTAFSSRAAVVAEGNLYWWGPQGIYHDDGVSIPQKISQRLEPLIYNLYDPNRTDEINCNYNYQTKEIIWFYDAKNDTSGKTSQLIYNYQEDAFYFCKDDCKVDASQQINTISPDADLSTAGLRTVIFSRANDSSSVQRAYFFDQNNRAGDMKPGTEFLVKTVGAITNGTITVTLASGFDPTAFAAIAAGQQFCLSQVTDYTNVATNTPDIITTVISKSSPNIVLQLPSSVTSYFAGTLANNKFFPIYNSVLNDIPYNMETRFWTPGGMRYWAYWLFCHLFFKVKLLADSLPLKLNFSYSTPVSGAEQTNVLTIEDNSKGNCQIYTSLKNVNRSHDGQGIKLRISGSHFGSQWVLQYLAMDANNQTLDEVKEFEG